MRLEAEAARSGMSKAELIRRGIVLVLKGARQREPVPPLPVFNSGKELSTDDMDQLIRDRINERAAHR